MRFSLQLGNFQIGNVASNIGDGIANSNFFIPFNANGEVVYYDLRNEKEFLTAYNLCSPLKSIISKRAKAFNNGKLEFLEKTNGNYATGSDAKYLTNLLIDRPNALQSGKQFFSQQNHYIDIFGYCPVLKVKAVGMNEVSSLWNIPPYLICNLDFTGKWLKQIDITEIYKRLTISWNGEENELDLKNVYFVFDDGIGTQIDTNLTIPDSRMVGNEYQVSNIIAAYKSRNTLITKRGAIGILTNDGHDQAGVVPMPGSEKENIQSDFRQYGLTGQPKQVIITDAALKWQQMGFATKDLLLFEEIEDDINRLCDSYGYPSELMSRGKDVSYDNKKEAKKSFYRDTVIPEAESRIQQNSKGILPKDTNIEIKVDFSDIDVIQAEALFKAQARAAQNEALQIEYDAGLITKNMWLIELGRDTVSNPEFDQYKSTEKVEVKINEDAQ